MKVLHVLALLDPAGGGPPRIAARLAAAQAGLGCQVAITKYRTVSHRQAMLESVRCIPHFEQVTRHALTPPGPIERLFGWRTRRQLRDHIAWADVVHLHGVWETLLRVAAAECRRQRRPYAVLINGMLHPWALAQKRLKKRLALAVAYRRMLDGAAFLHLGNRDEQEAIAPLGLTAPTEILPNGVFFEEIDPLLAPGAFHAKHPELRGRPFILFLSRLHPKKGLDYLAEAFGLLAPEHPQVELVVVGPDGGAQAPFEKRIAELGLTPRVHVLPALLGAHKYAAIADAHCVCLPSRQEGFSLAITEALACRTPVVISRECNFPEVAQVGAGEVVDLDPAAIAGALSRVLADEPLRRRMGRAGRQLVTERYTWPAIAARTLAAYERVLGRVQVAAAALAGAVAMLLEVCPVAL